MGTLLLFRHAKPLLGTLTLTALALLGSANGAMAEPVQIKQSDCSKAFNTLPLPSSLKQAEFRNFDVTLYDFLNCGKYLGLPHDKAVRNTGPFVFGSAYGTHPAVRIFYSPDIIKWLQHGKKGPIPDGAMMIKEQYKPPAARYDGMCDAQLEAALAASGKDWTVMIRDAKGSKDGWYWAEVYSGMKSDASNAWQAPFNYPNGGFGQYCLRCHSSAKDEHTFAALNNIEGFAGDPLSYYSDGSWFPPAADDVIEASRKTACKSTPPTPPRLQLAATPGKAPGSAKVLTTPASKAATLANSLAWTLSQAAPGSGSAATATPSSHGHIMQYHPPAPRALALTPAASAFQQSFPWIKDVPLGKVQMMVAETLDRTVSAQHGAKGYVSSDQCLMCHGGLSGASPVMFLPTVPLPSNGIGANVSPYGEWRWSPMGLAGRDPVFYAQLESELAWINSIPDKATATSLTDTTINTCFRCHGIMGKRQWDTDHHCEPANPLKPCNPAAPGKPQFKAEFTQISDSSNPHFKYGALARDGISCLACHRQIPSQQPPGPQQNELQFFLKNSITGLFQTGKPDVLSGPFKDVATMPMKNGLGITPEHSEYIKSSRMCGSCHSIYLPVIDKPPVVPVNPKTGHSMEQATYLEWLNSVYQNEFKPTVACVAGSQPQACAQTCQNCHMPGAYHNTAQKLDVAPIQTKIATVQDQDFPAADGLLAAKDIFVKRRTEGYARHELLGSNIFLLEMVKQFNTVFGVRTSDYMTGKTDGIEQTINNFAQQASTRTARVETNLVRVDAGKLVADVKVTNLAGHRLPSGVGFRRAFIEFLVTDNSTQQVIWSSGRSNELGVILDGNGKVLDSEFFSEVAGKDGKKHQAWQQHYQTIDAQDQVQIYEELTKDADGRFTTSFLRRDDEFKDNRLLPAGWSRTGPDPLNFKDVYLHATWPKGDAANDPDYQNGSGTDTVRYQASLPPGLDTSRLSIKATLYYQAMPPYFLAMRFKEAPQGAATQRLFYLASNLNLADSPARGWKLPLASSEKAVPKK
jgi:hypothetical protein